MDYLRTVEAFSSVFKCRVSFHDYDGRILACAGRFPLYHMNPFCEEVRKNKKCFARCCEMEAEMSRRHLAMKRSPFFKLCYAGIYELVMPLTFGSSLTGAMFIGPFGGLTPPQGFEELLIQKKDFSGIKDSEKKFFRTLRHLDTEETSNLLIFASLLAGKIESSFRREIQIDEEDSLDSKIKYYIDRNFRKDIYLKDIAAHLGVCEVRVCQILKKGVGRTFSSLLTARRIEHAKHLLKDSGLKTESIAAECGFHESPYFFKVFKRETGISPAAYRKKYKSPAFSSFSLLT